jgi:hypothetical protein
MPTASETDLLTRTSPGTSGGNLLRRYWLPAALSDELPTTRVPLAIELLGENLVLFRDDAGKPGLVRLHWSRRGADLSYGRHPAYPCMEQAGLIFAYLGPGAPPLLPAYDALTAPDNQRFVTKVFQDCNYLQANEGNLDPTHTSYLHRQFDDGAPDVRAGINGLGEAPNNLFARDGAPRLELEETDFGLRIYVIRSANSEMDYLRTSCFVYPNLCAIAGETSGDGYSIHWHVPIDDTHHWRYEVVYRASAPLGPERPLQYHAPVDAAWRLLQNKANRYRQDREEMRARSFSGMGPSFQVADACAVEGQGPIQDRAQEHLGYSDRAIVLTRQLLLRAIRQMESGADPPHVIRDPRANAFPELAALSQLAPKDADYRTCWRTQRL